MQWRVDDAGGHGIEANVFLCVLQSEAFQRRVQPPCLIIGMDAVAYAAIGLSTSAAVMLLTMLPPVFCACICLTASCVT